ncbi:hypothetical protein DsansV1_C29g0207731 [Dioscorea sansibarensis]
MASLASIKIKNLILKTGRENFKSPLIKQTKPHVRVSLLLELFIEMKTPKHTQNPQTQIFKEK